MVVASNGGMSLLLSVATFASSAQAGTINFQKNHKITEKRTGTHEVNSTLFNTIHDIAHDSFHCANVNTVPLNSTDVSLLLFGSEGLSQGGLRFEVGSFSGRSRRGY